MAIDLSKVEPLGSKSVLLEQALRRHRSQNQAEEFNSADMEDMVSPDFEWLKDDKTAIQGLVKQMDASIGQLAKQMRDLETVSDKSREKVEKEQQLLFKQIRTLNSLLKKQVDIFAAVERQMSDIEIKNNNLIPQVGIGLISGLMSAVTILATAPWLSVLIENLRG
jgi:vacuolar-type H+-ATPase subunit I/STV1